MSCRADPMTVSGQFSCPPPGNYLAVSGQSAVAADTRLPLLAVRHGRAWPWLRAIAIRILLTGVALVLALAVVTLLLAAITGRDLSAGPTGAIWHQFLVNGALQVYVSGMVVVFVALLTGSEIAGVWTLLVLIVLGIPSITHGYFPSSLHMLGFLQEISP